MTLISSLPSYSGAPPDNAIVPGSVGGASYGFTIDQFAAAASANGRNFLLDGGFDRWGNGGVASAANMTDATYDALTNWYSLVEGAGPTIARNAGSDGSLYTAKMIAGTTTSRWAIAQVVPHALTVTLQDQAVVFQTRVRSNLNAGVGNNTDLRCAILAWNGTADAVTLDCINNWANSSYTTGNFFASSDLAVVAVSDQLQAAHNVWNDLTATGVVDSGANNLILICWTEDVPAHAADYFEIGKAGLYVGEKARFWSPTKTVPYEIIHLQDQKSDGTNGGTFTAGAWQTRELNTIVADTGGHCSLASNQFTLEAGVYEVRARATAHRVTYHRLRLRNVDDSETLSTLSGNEWSTSTADNTGNAELMGVFTISQSKTFELQHYCQTTNASFGYGLDDNMSLGVEIYTDIILRKVS